MCCSNRVCLLITLFAVAIFLLGVLICITVNIHTGGSIAACTCNGHLNARKLQYQDTK